MRILIATTLLAFLTLAAGESVASTGAARRAFEGKDLFALKWASDPQIRRDGSMVAYVRHANDAQLDQEQRSIWIVDVATGVEKAIATQPGSYSSPRWSPDGTRLAYLFSEPQAKSAQIFIYSVRSGETSAITNVAQTPRDIAWSPDGQSVAFIMLVPEPAPTLGAALTKPEGATWADPLIVIKDVNYRADGQGYLKHGYSHVFVVSAEGGTPRQVTSGSYSEAGPVSWTPDGANFLLATNRETDWKRQSMEPSGSYPRHLNIYRVRVADGNFTAINPQRVGSFKKPIVSPDGAHIAYVGFDDRKLGSHNTQVTVTDRGGRESRVLTSSLDRPVDTCFWAANSRSLYCSYTDQGVTQVAQLLLDGRTTTVVPRLAGAEIETPYSGGDFSLAAGGSIAYTSGAGDQPPEVYLSRAGKISQLTHLNDELFATVQLGSVRPLAVTSSFDKRSIGAWMLTPPNFDRSKKYPMILEIHGGPYASYGPSFSTTYQLFAAAGYVVVYGNPRGSTSYGEEFANLIQYNYPGQDFDDLMSIVDAAIDQGGVDANNLFVTGASGGGILTAWIVGGTQRFRAAASRAPVVNWSSWVLTSDVYAHVARNWFKKLPWEDPGTYWKQSPLSRVGNVTTPTLMVVGDRDLRTTAGQAEQFYQALQLKNSPTELVYLPGMYHGTGRPSQLAAEPSAILAWFDRYKALGLN
jgi:dipeptidyl aminopeptidase/acylaminoacyl peptidase